MVGARPSPETIRAWLADVPDPELPVLSIVDLGIVREVAWDGATLRVAITPTYSGCPATRVIADDVARALRRRGLTEVALDVRLAPAWTSDWLGAEAREKLRAYGIAPPSGPAAEGDRTAICPRCGAADTALVSRFGSTPCKALHRCLACREPFDAFKCH